MPGDDEQDKAGILASPPLIYLPALVFGLLLNRRFPKGMGDVTKAEGFDTQRFAAVTFGLS